MSRGINAVQEESELLDGKKSSLIPCYIGSSPYWQIDRTDWASLAGQAFVIKSITDAKSKIGFFKPESGKWARHVSICEAVYAHFGDRKNVIGPIIVLLNAEEVSVAAEPVTANVVISNGYGTLDVGGLAILSSFSITGKVKGIDYTIEYDDTGNVLIITDLKKALGTNVSVTYSVVEKLDTLVFTASTFDAIDYFEQTIFKVPTVLLAPGWDDQVAVPTENSVGSMLLNLSEGQINNHWYTQSYAQLSSTARDSIASEKAEKGYNSPKMKVCWPYVKKDGLIYCLTTKFVVAKMKVDISNDNIPFESASNEILDIDGLCDISGKVVLQNEKAANSLNEIGIATCNFAQGDWRTWGVCMSNYLESNKDNIKPEYLNDVAVQMRDYVSNDFQAENFDYIDKPIPPRKAKEIVGDYQVVLNSLVNFGALLFGEISFNTAENPPSSIADGEFVFNIAETNTPPGKSITGKVKYTATGLDSYFREEDE